MAVDPQFAAVVNIGAALLGAAETNLQVPTTTSVVLPAGATGSKIEEVVVHAASTALTPTTVPGLVYLFLYDGATYHLYDTITVTAVTASATAAPFRTSKTYTNLLLESGWSLRASQSIAGNASILKVEAFGGDY
jgi:hypothetical protein